MSDHATTPTQLPDPPPVYRWMVLIVISLAMFGNYYIYDSISPLADLLVSQLGFSDSNIGLLNAIYSVPNIIMVLIGGIVIDRIGTKKSILIFAVLCFAGAAVTASSAQLSVMAAGRLIFGLGAESLIVAVTTSLARWFKGKELSFAFGLNLTIARLGSFAALNSPSWARPLYDDWQYPLLLGVGAGVICIVAALIYYGQDGY
ncbi:MAG: MFS transporter, partial [Bacteroidetes bacterium]|nr:MFS transporter [Bacteroidota bacterium]